MAFFRFMQASAADAVSFLSLFLPRYLIVRWRSLHSYGDGSLQGMAAATLRLAQSRNGVPTMPSTVSFGSCRS